MSLLDNVSLSVAGLDFVNILPRFSEIILLTIFLLLLFLVMKKIYNSKKLTIGLSIAILLLSLFAGIVIGFNEGRKIALYNTVNEWCNASSTNTNVCNTVCYSVFLEDFDFNEDCPKQPPP